MADVGDRGGRRELEERLALLVHAARDYAIFTLDVDGHVTSWNLGARRLKGYEEHEILGRHFSTFYPPEDVERGKPEQLLAIATADGSVEDEGWRVRKDGTRFWADVVITALRGPDGDLRGFGKVTRDLSDRRRADDLLHRNEQRFRLMVESVRDYAIFMLDPEGRVVSWNQGAERLKGYAAEEIIGEHFSRFYRDEDIRDGKPTGELVQAAAEGRVEDEGWRVRKDGSRFWANVVITALRNADGDLVGYGKVTRDLTDRKRAEDALRGVLAREREVAERLRELDKTKDEILSTVAHDLRTPLSVIGGYLDLLLQEPGRISPEQQRELLGRMRTSARGLWRLVDDVLDVTRIDTRRVEYDISVFDADALAARVLSDVAGAAVGRVLLEHSTGGSLKARGDERRSWQVLANLVSNAMKFSPTDAPVRVSVRAAAGDEVHLTVEDQGPGIAPDDQRRVFEKFSRVPHPGGAEGTGLGLYIARSFAEGQGGRIELSSEVGRGATFTFILPAAPR